MDVLAILFRNFLDMTTKTKILELCNASLNSCLTYLTNLLSVQNACVVWRLFKALSIIWPPPIMTWIQPCELKILRSANNSKTTRWFRNASAYTTSSTQTAQRSVQTCSCLMTSTHEPFYYYALFSLSPAYLPFENKKKLNN